MSLQQLRPKKIGLLQSEPGVAEQEPAAPICLGTGVAVVG